MRKAGKDYYSLCVDEETEGHTSHIHTHMHILVRMKNILWYKLIHLFHYLMAMSQKSLCPSGNHGRIIPQGPQAGGGGRQQKKQRAKGRAMFFEQELPPLVA